MTHDEPDDEELRAESLEPGASIKGREPETPAGPSPAEAVGEGSRAHLHLSDGQDVRGPSTKVPEPPSGVEVSETCPQTSDALPSGVETPPGVQEPGTGAPKPELAPSEKIREPEDVKAANPWVPKPGQDDPEPPPPEPVPVVKAKGKPNWVEEQRKKRVENAIKRQEERRAKVAEQRSSLKEQGFRVCGGEELEDCGTSDDDSLPARVKPVLELPREPWKPPEEDRQVALLEGPTDDPEVMRKRTEMRHSPASTCLDDDDVTQFLTFYAKTGLYGQAAFSVGRSIGSVKAFEKDNPAFSQLIAEAYQVYRERIAHEVHTRGVTGIVVPVFGKDGQVGWTRQFSDRLLELEARAAWPEKYREDAPSALPTDVKFGVLVVPGVMASPEEWEQLHGQAARGLPEPIEPSNPMPNVSRSQPVAVPKVTRPVGTGGRGKS